MNADRFVNLECVFCLIVNDDDSRRATPARTVLKGYAVCLDHATMTIESLLDSDLLTCQLVATARRQAEAGAQ